MIVACDASQLEWRVILQLANDEVGISEVLNGDDTHALNQAAFNLPSRLIAKVFLFRTIFRGSGYAFATDPNFSHVSDKPKYWDERNEMFYKKYYGIDKTHKQWADLVLAGKPIVSPFGREWIIPLGRDRFGEIKLPMTTLSNYSVQGSAADIMALARVSLQGRLKKKNLPVLMIQTVHDSIVIDCEEKYVQDVAELYHSVFGSLQKNIKNIFHYDWKVPLKCEVKTGMNMHDMSPYNI